MYNKFYGLNNKPFELAPDPAMVFLSETHQEALAVLLYGVHNRKGFLQISGKVGTGKSTLVQALIGKLENNVVVCHIPNPHFTVAEFYYYVGAKFGLPAFDGNKAKFILDLADFLKQCREKGSFALLIIDEAQMLSLELLEEIRLLSNQEFSEFGVLSIFFVGQPELNVLLKHEKMKPLRNRIGIRFNLAPLTLDETFSYVKFRLEKAGRSVRLFSPNALEKIHEASGGIPRSINILCDNALLTGFAEQRGIIDENIIIRCVAESEDPGLETEKKPRINAHQETISQQPVSVKSTKKVNRASPEKKTVGIWKKTVFAAAAIFAFFMLMTYTTEYWKRVPGIGPAASWFDELHVKNRIIEKITELYIASKRALQSKTTGKNIFSNPENQSSGLQKDESVSQGEPFEESAGIKENSREANTAHASPLASEQDNEMVSEGAAGPKLIVPNDQLDEPISPIGQDQARTYSRNNTFLEDPTSAEPFEIIDTSDETIYVSITNVVGGANIRSGPSMNSPVMRAVIPGYPFRVLGHYNDWSLVEDFKARKGWVASKLIVDNSTVMVMVDSAYLLTGPGYQQDIVADLHYGTLMQVSEKRGIWLKVQYGGDIAGWIPQKAVWPDAR